MKTAFLEGGRDGPRQRLQTRNNWGGGGHPGSKTKGLATSTRAVLVA